MANPITTLRRAFDPARLQPHQRPPTSIKSAYVPPQPGPSPPVHASNPARPIQTPKLQPPHSRFKRPYPPPPPPPQPQPVQAPSLIQVNPLFQLQQQPVPRVYGHDYHPKRQYTAHHPSFRGPLTICPSCHVQFVSEWHRDLNFMERHVLGVKAGVTEKDQVYNIEGEVDVSEGRYGNYDGPLGRAAHVLEPWTYCEEPEEYADEVGDVIPGHAYFPPSDAFLDPNAVGQKYIDNEKLPPKARAIYERNKAKQARAELESQVQMRELKRKRALGDDDGEKGREKVVIVID